jgi:hypothetical protein
MDAGAGGTQGFAVQTGPPHSNRWAILRSPKALGEARHKSRPPAEE